MTAKTAKKPTIAECDAQFIRPGTIFEMGVETINGREYRVWKQGHRTLRPYFLERMDHFADRVFINAERGGERVNTTYGELHTQAVCAAAWLRSWGVGLGTRVAIVGFNSAEWVIAFVALALLGAVPVIVNAWVTPDAMVHCLRLARPVLVLADGESADALAPHASKLSQIFAWSPTKHLPTIDLTNIPASVKDILAVTSGEGLAALGPHSPGAIFFTSGTTGMPKGVPLTQSAILHNIKSAQASAMRAGLRAGAPVDMVHKLLAAAAAGPQVKTLHAVPLFHITGCASLVMAFSTGRQLVFMRRWSVAEAVRLLVEYDLDAIGGVPAISSAILQSPLLPKDFQLKAASYGGAAAPARLAEDLKTRFPDVALATAWGMTEGAGLLTSFSGDDYLERPKSAGVPVPVTDVRVVDMSTGKILPPYAVGVIHVRGHNVTHEYLDDPAATAKAIDADGWLDTGDAGYIDAEGFVYISDRIKDIIIRGGENIASEEVDNAVYLDDRVAEAAAVPVPCDRMGELVAVAVSLKPGATATPEEVIAQVAPRLRREARPVFVWVSDDLLPMNANGKYIKTEIKAVVQDMYKQHMARQSKL